MKDFTLKSILQSVLVVIDKLSAECCAVLENFVDCTTKKFIILFFGGTQHVSMEDSYLCGYLKIKGLTEVNFKTRSDIVRLTGSLWLNWEQKKTRPHVSRMCVSCVSVTLRNMCKRNGLKAGGQSNLHMDIRELRLIGFTKTGTGVICIPSRPLLSTRSIRPSRPSLLVKSSVGKGPF